MAKKLVKRQNGGERKSNFATLTIVPEKRVVIKDKSKAKPSGKEVRKTTTRVYPEQGFTSTRIDKDLDEAIDRAANSKNRYSYVEKSKEKYDPRKKESTTKTYIKGNRAGTMDKSTINYKKSGGSIKRKK